MDCNEGISSKAPKFQSPGGPKNRISAYFLSLGKILWSHEIGGRIKRAKYPTIIFENREGLR
jgi:hypothetical protein